jgi:hypothetical protein
MYPDTHPKLIERGSYVLALLGDKEGVLGQSIT